MSLNIEYNNRYQISKHDWKKNGVTTAGYNYGHDSVGNRIWSENLVTSNKSELFSFDNADRLTSFKTGTLNANKDNVVAPTYSQSWNLDSIGNWAGFTDNGTSSTNTFSDTHEMTQFKGVTQTFDNNGNLTSDGVRAFKYDAFNRIIEVKIGTIILAEYQYDAFNRRVMKKVDADLNSSFETTVKFLYDGFRCIEELNASDALVQEYVYGSLYIDEVILQRAGAIDYYFTHDYRYSITSLTDNAGSIVESYDYKVYGERTASGSGLTDVGYTGQRHDSETGLMYFKNRYYSTSMGSFVTRDPKEYIDGMSMYLGYFGGQGADALGLYEIEFEDGVEHEYELAETPYGVIGVWKPIVGGRKRVWSVKEKEKVKLVHEYYKKVFPLVEAFIDKLIKELNGCGCDKIKKNMEKMKAILSKIKVKLNSKDKIKYIFRNIKDKDTIAYVTDDRNILNWYRSKDYNGSETGGVSVVYINFGDGDFTNFFAAEFDTITTPIHEISHGFQTEDYKSTGYNENDPVTFEQLFSYPDQLIDDILESNDAKSCKKTINKANLNSEIKAIETEFNSFFSTMLKMR